MKKLLHVIDSMGIGGAEKLVLSVMNGIGEEVEQHLIVLSEPVPLLEQIKVPCKTTVLNYRSYRDLWNVSRFIKRYIRDKSIDIVHSQSFWSNIATRLAAGKKTKVFNSLQAVTSEAAYKVNRLSLYLEKLTYRKRHHIIGVSAEVLSDFDRWVGLKGPSSVLYNSIDEKFFAAGFKSEFSPIGLKLVAVGNLRWQKNYIYAIEAFKKMPPGISLDIYGEGDLRNEFQEAIDKYHLNIRLCGHHHQLEKVLPDYDVLLMCSWYEGFSLGLMEAMACGLPPVVSDVPVLKEAAGDTALYIDLSNPDDLVCKINYLLQHPDELRSMSANAYQRAYALARTEVHLKKLLELYAVRRCVG